MRRRAPSLALVDGRIRAEVARLFAPPVRMQRAVFGLGPVTAVSLACVVALHWGHQSDASLVERISGVRAYLPLWVEATRLPASIVAPAPRLPMWGALAQVAVVFGLTERALGSRRCLVLIALFHTAATLAGRGMIDLGPGAPFGLGLPHSLSHALDTGPSAAVAGLCVYVSFGRRTPILCGLLAAVMLSELVWSPDLAGREHVVAMAVGAVTAVGELGLQRAGRWAIGGGRRAPTAPVRAQSPVGAVPQLD